VGENPTAIFIYKERTVQNIYKGSYLKQRMYKEKKIITRNFLAKTRTQTQTSSLFCTSEA
jgi:hypothetical protein